MNDEEHGDDHKLSQTKPIAGVSIDDWLAQAQALFAEASSLVASHVVQVRQRASVALSYYDGFPVRFNLMGLYGLEDNERVYTRLLAWLLDPKGSHGLGDAVLRRFLARVGDASASRLALSIDELEAVTRTELAVGSGFLDVVVVCRGLIVAIEGKIWATETVKEFDGRAVKQTSYYRLHLEEPESRRVALNRLPAAAGELAGRTPRIIGVLVSPARETSEPRQDGNAMISWRQIERDLATATRRRRPTAEAEASILCLRSMLLERTGSSVPELDYVMKLREFCDMPSAIGVSPISLLADVERLESLWQEDE